MAIFTVELGELVESGFDIGLDDYPIFDATYRDVLNRRILEHFWFREIGQETPGLFVRFLNRRLHEIMPYYNELYKSQRIVFDPLSSHKMTTESDTTNDHTASSTEESTGHGTNEATGRTLNSTTPQTQLMGHEDYASGLTDSTSKADSDTTGNVDTTSAANTLTNYVANVSGYAGQNPSEAIMKFRQSLINVDLMVLDELEIVFMGLWNDTVGGM